MEGCWATGTYDVEKMPGRGYAQSESTQQGKWVGGNGGVEGRGEITGTTRILLFDNQPPLRGMVAWCPQGWIMRVAPPRLELKQVLFRTRTQQTQYFCGYMTITA